MPFTLQYLQPFFDDVSPSSIPPKLLRFARLLARFSFRWSVVFCHICSLTNRSHQGRQGEHGLQQAAREAAQGDSGRPGGGLRWVPGEVGLRCALQGHRAPRALVFLFVVLFMLFFSAVGDGGKWWLCRGVVRLIFDRRMVVHVSRRCCLLTSVAARTGGWVDWMYE